MKRNRVVVGVIVGVCILCGLVLVRSYMLSRIFQDPLHYKAKFPGGVESMQVRKFGAMEVRLLPGDRFELVSSNKEDTIANNEVWLMLNKRIPLYAQFSDLTLENEDHAWNKKKAIQDAVLIWEKSFNLKKIKEQYADVQDQMRYEGYYQDQMGEVIVHCIVSRQKDRIRMFILRGPGFQKSLVDSIAVSVKFEGE